MSIEIFSPNIQPFGLLSNNAPLPITINDEKYASVNEFVFSNVFTTKRERARAKNQIAFQPFPIAMKMLDEKMWSIYMAAIKLGMKARFAQNELFRNSLKSTEGTIQVVLPNHEEARQMTLLLLELKSSQVVPEWRKGVDSNLLNAVIGGVLKQLLANSNFPNGKFDELTKFADKNVPPMKYGNVIAHLTNLDEIVQVVRIQFRDQIYGEEIIRFKKHLLDVVLDYFLAKDFPHIAKKDYWQAKWQQVQKQKRLGLFEDRLFRMYELNLLNVEIELLLQWHPSFPDSNNVNAENIEKMTRENLSFPIVEEPSKKKIVGFKDIPSKSIGIVIEEGKPEIIVPRVQDRPKPKTKFIGPNNFLLAQWEDRITIEGKPFDSVLRYAFWKLFDKLGKKNINVNSFTLADLKSQFEVFKNEKLFARISYNNRIALKAKFAAYDSLKALLVASNDQQIFWMDKTDPVLGAVENGKNIAGLHLMELRQEFAKEKLGIPVNFHNTVFSNLLYSRSQDYANTLKLFVNKNSPDLIAIYGFSPFQNNFIVSETEKLLMNKGGLSESDQLIVYPFIREEFARFASNGNALEAAKGIVNFFHQFGVTETEGNLAVKYLSDAFDRVKQNLFHNVDQKLFVNAILSNSQEKSNFFEHNQQWRVFYWSKLATEKNITT